MNIPAPIKLTPEEIKMFQDLTSGDSALRQFIAMVSEQGERRAAQIQGQGKAAWAKMAEKYGIDIKNIMWDVTEDGYIKPVTVRLGE